MFKLLKQPNFRWLWFGSFISLIGDWFLFVGLPIYIYTLTNSALATGAMFLAQRLPLFCLEQSPGW